MDLTLRVDTQAGTTVVRLFKDRASPRSDTTLACAVSCRGDEYRSDIPASEVEELVRLIGSTTVPSVGGCGFGLDGCSFELTIKEGAAKATYQWWMTPDPSWAPLEAIAVGLINLGGQISGQYLP
jgi:hypothetical protein